MHVPTHRRCVYTFTCVFARSVIEVFIFAALITSFSALRVPRWKHRLTVYRRPQVIRDRCAASCRPAGKGQLQKIDPVIFIFPPSWIQMSSSVFLYTTCIKDIFSFIWIAQTIPLACEKCSPRSPGMSTFISRLLEFS